MNSVRMNVSVPEEVFKEISRHIEPRKRSQFITQAVKRSLNELKKQRLAAEYEEVAAEIRRVNEELEGVVSDGLD